MSSSSPFGFPQFDPSKMDPKVLMQLTQLIQQLPPDQLSRMQSLMHNAMAGLDVRREMEEFEKNLPPGFREKLMSLMAGQVGTGFTAPQASGSPTVIEAESSRSTSQEMDVHEARLTILRAVANGIMPPEEAEKLLFRT
jgi:hypothetical protein